MPLRVRAIAVRYPQRMGQAVEKRIQGAIASRPGVRLDLFNAEVIKVDGEDCILSTVSEVPQHLSPEDRDQQKSSALDLVRDSVVALDSQGHITYLNHAAEQLYGWRSAEAAGSVARTVLFADNQEAFDTAWRAVRERGEWRGEFVQKTKNGIERFVESRWSALRRRESSRITSVMVVSTDISKLNEATAGIAHEIRNPLASIKGVADAFLQRRQLTSQEREWMEAVRREVLKIDTRIRELLNVSQPRILNVKQCSLNELISGVVLLARHRTNSFDDRPPAISVQFVDTTTEPLTMSLDPACIEDAVLNLVLNAIESIEGNGRVTVCLRRRVTNGDGEAMIEVTDTGCGIPLHIRRKIFEPLFTTKCDGIGLGLAAVRRTAAAYHGRVTFKTRIGHGSKFVLALPLQSQRLTENPK